MPAGSPFPLFSNRSSLPSVAFDPSPLHAFQPKTQLYYWWSWLGQMWLGNTEKGWVQVKAWLKAMKILPRPFPIAYIRGWHRQDVNQKKWVNPELKAMEVLPRPSPITYIQSSKEHILEQEILLPTRPPCQRKKNVKRKTCSYSPPP